MFNQITRRRGTRFARRGVAILESALTLSATLLLLMGLLDLGIATLQYNSLGHACRFVSRAITLRGVESPDTDAMGPTTMTGHANDGSDTAQMLVAHLPTMAGASVAYSVEWLDGDNGPGDRVRVEMSYVHHPFVPGLASWGAITLRAASTMHIVN
jgi:hypothetical protein